MPDHIPCPNVEQLLPAFLAHVPIAFSSTRVPPSLFPLLSPILRSRVRLLSSSQPTASGDISQTWLSLLTWSRDSGPKLAMKFASQEFQPHPSGEIEIGDYRFKGIRRLDLETLQASTELKERGIEIVYIWVPVDEEGTGWKILDIKVLDDEEKEDNLEQNANKDWEWHSTVAAADQAYCELKKDHSLLPFASHEQVKNEMNEDDNDDDAYWALYDGSSSEPPMINHSPTKQPTEEEYFARYSTVSPALEPSYTPANNVPTSLQPQATPPSTFTHLSTATTYGPISIPISPPTSSPRTKSISSKPSTPQDSTKSETTTTVSPRPKGSSTGAVTKLENQASAALQAEVAIKHYISSQLKSLYRLSKSVGIDHVEFRRIVGTEMEILQMVDEDDAG